jgi:hypothetical protein
MSSIPANFDALLTREQTSEALKESGFPIEPTTLATKASRGGGPPYEKFGPRALYRWGNSLAWAQSRLSAPRRNTSEGDAIGQGARAESAPPSVDSSPRVTSSTMRLWASSDTETKPAV